MKARLLDWIVCPACRGPLAVTAGAVARGELAERGELVDGRLTCQICRSAYPVVRGIPRLMVPDMAAGAAVTAERFGYEWTRFPELRPEYEEQFRGWIAPVGPGDFRDRLVLDAGCGKGRHLRIAAAFGAREVIGLELGPAVEVAAKNTADLDNVHVVQADLARPPVRAACIEMIYSIGVLHHLEQPTVGVRALARLLAPGGALVAWLYAREGNGWVLGLLDPLRRVTRRLSLPVVSALARLLTVPLWVALRLMYGPARSRAGLRRWLPYASYLSDLAVFPFREIHSIAFDQLLAPVAHYMPRGDVERAFADGGLALRSLRWHHANSWAAWGVRRNGASNESAALP